MRKEENRDVRALHTTPKEFENEFVVEEKSLYYRDVIVFEKLRFQYVFCPH